MNDAELKKLMTEWGIAPIPGQAYEANVLGFAKEVEAAEREACAKTCESLYETIGPACDDHPTAYDAEQAIRARKEG